MTHKRKLLMGFQLAISFLGFAGYMYCMSFPRKEYGEAPRLIGMICFVLAVFGRHLVNPFFKLRPRREVSEPPVLFGAERGESTADEALKERAVEIAAKKRVNLVNVAISEPGYAIQALSPIFFEGTLRIPRRAVCELTPDELDFALAYTLDSLFRQMLWVMLPCFAPIPILAIATHLFRLGSFRLVLFLPIALVPMVFVLMPFLTRRATASAVRRALAVAPSVEAARSYFAKIQPEARKRTLFSRMKADPWEDYAKTYLVAY